MRQVYLRSVGGSGVVMERQILLWAPEHVFDKEMNLQSEEGSPGRKTSVSGSANLLCISL
jgi:hypothetical protein